MMTSFFVDYQLEDYVKKLIFTFIKFSLKPINKAFFDRSYLKI